MKKEEKYLKNLENINQFNKFFLCDNVNNIIKLYNQEDKVWQHPLLLNYSYCTFCNDKPKSSYNINSISKFHLKVEPSLFLSEKKIKLRHIKGKNNILTKRRFIHSTEHNNLKGKCSYFIGEQFLHYSYDEMSDSDLYVHKKKRKIKKYFPQNNILTCPSFRSCNDKVSHVKSRSVFPKMKSSIIITPQTKTSTYNIEDDRKEILHTLNNSKPNDTNYSNQQKGSLFNFFNIFSRNENKKFSSPQLDLDTKIDLVIMNTLPNKDNSSNSETKNECCDLCLQDIKDKFVLGCGDFYCRECIRGVLLMGINDVSKFDKMICPKEICGEPIEEGMIAKLLNKEEYEKYSKIRTRIEGLKNHNYIPCPYPDCESFGHINDISKNVLKCNNEHIFCVKCLACITLGSKNEHVCQHKSMDPTYEYLSTNKFIKQCPNCHTWVEREPGGCNNMTCQNIWCNYEFCWICDNQYDSSHYKNPFSICFGLEESSSESKFSKYKSIRIAKCIAIFLFLIFVGLPILLAFSSFLFIGIYVMTFVLDGSTMKNIKFSNQKVSEAFHIILYCFYALISIASIPFGYLAFAGVIIGLPIICICNRISNEKEEEAE